MKRMPRICLITPGHLATNPRLVKEADALAEAGYEVGVIAADFVGWARKLDRSLENRRWRVVQTLPFGPEAPRMRRMAQLLRRGVARTLSGLGLSGAWIDGAAWHPLTPELARAACKVEADLYIAHYPAALPAAALAARRNGAAYAFDAEDFHPGDAPDGAAFDRDRRLLDLIERRWLPGCAYVTAAAPLIGRAYQSRYPGEKVEIVLNVFPKSHAPEGPTARGTAAGPSVYWFSQTIGPDRGLECAIAAIGVAKSRPHLYLRGTAAPAYRDRLHAIARECGAGDRLHLLEPASPNEMERLAAAYDLGLASETALTENHRYALANKIFSYLLAGVPVIASDVQSHRELAPEMGDAMTLFRIDDKAHLAAQLDQMLEDPDRLSRARTHAYRLGASRFNWDHERAVLLACVEAALGSDTVASSLAS